MTGGKHGNFTTAFVHHAGLLAGVLAVIAGILGMHVMTGTHSSHYPAAITASGIAAPAADTGHSDSPPGHAAHGAPVAALAYPQSSLQDEDRALEQCSCSGGCANRHAMTVACTPAAKTGSLSAPLPGTTVIGVSSSGATDGIAPGLWSYLPGTPSPGELSISRT